MREHLDRLRALLKERRYEEVLEQSGRLLARVGDNAALLSVAASAAYGLGRFEQARDLLQRALERQPDSAVLRDGLERVNRRLRDG